MAWAAAALLLSGCLGAPDVAPLEYHGAPDGALGAASSGALFLLATSVFWVNATEPGTFAHADTGPHCAPATYALHADRPAEVRLRREAPAALPTAVLLRDWEPRSGNFTTTGADRRALVELDRARDVATLRGTVDVARELVRVELRDGAVSADGAPLSAGEARTWRASYEVEQEGRVFRVAEHVTLAHVGEAVVTEERVGPCM